MISRCRAVAGADAGRARAVQARQHHGEVADEAHAEGEPSLDDAVAEQRQRAVEVLDGLEEAPAIVERLRDVLLEDGALRGIAAVRVQLEVELRRFLEEVQRLARRRRARRLGAGAEEKRLGALGDAALAVVVREHPA